MGITIASRSRKWTKGASKMWRETPGKGIEWRGKKADFVVCLWNCGATSVRRLLTKAPNAWAWAVVYYHGRFGPRAERDNIAVRERRRCIKGSEKGVSDTKRSFFACEKSRKKPK